MSESVECIVCKGTGKVPVGTSAADWAGCFGHVLMAGCTALVVAGLMLDRGVPWLVVAGAAPIVGLVASHVLGWLRRAWRKATGRKA